MCIHNMHMQNFTKIEQESWPNLLLHVIFSLKSKLLNYYSYNFKMHKLLLITNGTLSPICLHVFTLAAWYTEISKKASNTEINVLIKF